MFISIGFGNYINADKIVSYIRADAAPIKRMVQTAKDSGMAVDATCGKKTKTVIVMESGHVVLSSLTTETIQNRTAGKE